MNKVALVTGASRGIGLEVVKQLANSGMRVVLGARNFRKGDLIAQELRSNGQVVECMELDMDMPADIAKVSSYIESKFGRLDVLVNNAAIALDFNVAGLDVDLDVVRKTFITNVCGPLFLIQSVVPLMKKHGYGRIVNVSSGLGSFSKIGKGRLAYRMSKTALNVMTKSLAEELMGTNILVNAVTPGWVRTRMGGVQAERSVEQGADSIVWLCSLPDGGASGAFFKDREVFPW